MEQIQVNIAELSKEKEERERKKKEEKEAAWQLEKTRNACLDASIKKLIEAHNKELKRSDNNQQQLDVLCGAQASLQKLVLEAAMRL